MSRWAVANWSRWDHFIGRVSSRRVTHTGFFFCLLSLSCIFSSSSTPSQIVEQFHIPLPFLSLDPNFHINTDPTSPNNFHQNEFLRKFLSKNISSDKKISLRSIDRSILIDNLLSSTTVTRKRGRNLSTISRRRRCLSPTLKPRGDRKSRARSATHLSENPWLPFFDRLPRSRLVSSRARPYGDYPRLFIAIRGEQET